MAGMIDAILRPSKRGSYARDDKTEIESLPMPMAQSFLAIQFNKLLNLASA